jgi:hypothetical protein
MDPRERLAQFEDEKLKDAPRQNGGLLERGHGSHFQQLSDADKRQHRALEDLVAAHAAVERAESDLATVRLRFTEAEKKVVAAVAESEHEKAERERAAAEKREAERAERAQQERDEKIAAEAVERDRIAAEEKAANEEKAAARERERVERVDREKADVTARAEPEPEDETDPPASRGGRHSRRSK